MAEIPPGMSGTHHIDGSTCTYPYDHRCEHPSHGDLAGVQFDANHEPIPEKGTSMTTETSDLERAQLQLTLGMNDEGEALSADERALLEEFVASQEPAAAADQAPSTAQYGLGATDPAEEQQTAPQDLQAMIAQEVAKVAAGLAPQAAGIPDTETFLRATDPKDSDTALMMLQWLIDTGRLSNIGTINGGGYMFHYQEPKGTTKAGYTPGATKGGRMVDQALDDAKAAGGTPRKTGICDKCWSAVEQQDDGTVVHDDTKDPTCSAGGAHTFNA